MEIPKEMDGVSFKESLQKNVTGKLILVEYFGEANAGSIDRNCPWYDDANLSVSYIIVVQIVVKKTFNFALNF